VAVVVLKPGHVQPVWAGHPWVYAQAVERVEGGAIAGGEVDVQDAKGNWLGRGLYSPGSALRVRIFVRDPSLHVDDALLETRIRAAFERRKLFGLPSAGTTALRVVHAEGDGLPGLVVDAFGDVAVVQFGTLGLKQRQEAIASAVTRTLGARAVLDKSSARAGGSEGFDASGGVIAGDASVRELSFSELGLRYVIPLELTQKTGFYLDQRPLRQRVQELAAGRRVLDTFSYVGSLAMAAARGGAAEVTAVDSSALALEVAAENAAANGLSGRIQFDRRDASEALNHAGRHGGADLVIVDPPKLAFSKGGAKRALELMRKLSAAGCRATTPGGLLVICSCSAAIGVDQLVRAVALGGRDVGVMPLVLERWFQGADHPVPAAFPEGLYLSSVIVQVTPR
jgi:23S rRNA (cytosine1962-C5)-methyltransferase